ncbi:hypothetical protein B6U99_03750 [Candidatus Geothermarchaeota archaeon ex4572_27]|nr:MAG: hypothetical protein B6U99_03750 [Candidatus Geothermarchaeota archaeon ex4572_27]
MRLMQSGLSPYRVEKILGIPAATLRGWLRRGRKPPATHWEPRPSPETAYVLGVLLGDGCVIHKRNGTCFIRLVAVDYEFVYEFSRNLAATLGKPTKKPYKIRRKESQRDLWAVSYGSKAFYSWYKPLHDAVVRGNVDALKQYVEVEHNKEIVRKFLRGLFDSDGSHYCRPLSPGKLSYIRFYNTNKVLVLYVQYLLQRYFSICSRIYEDRYGKRQGHKVCYVLTIYPQPYVKRFLAEIGFTIVRKQRGGRWSPAPNP